MALSNYANGATTITTTPTLICTPEAESNGVIIQNNGTPTIYIGGANVTATGAYQGISLAANTTITVPTQGGNPHQLYAITASSTATVTWLYPEA